MTALLLQTLTIGGEQLLANYKKLENQGEEQSHQ
jgi:hypothetical protein